MMVPELTDILAIIFFLLLIILWKALKKESKKNKSTFNKNIDYIIKEYDITPEENNNDNITIYEQKPLMSNYEFKFYKILEELKEEYENMKLRIENERLKKGYLVKGDGLVVVFKK